MNWFERHLNYTVFLSWVVTLLLYIILIFVIDPTGGGDAFLWYLLLWYVLLACFIVLPLIVEIWALRRKNRSLWWLLMLYFVPFGAVVFLCLENRSEQKALEGKATEVRADETPRLVAIEKETEGIQEIPDNTSWLLKQALGAFDKKHYRYSSWLCWVETRRNPNDYFALCQYAQSLYHLGKANDRKAASLYKRAIEIKPDYPLAHAGLGLIHYENAKRIYQEYSMFPGGDWLMFADEKSPDNENKHSIITSYADYQVGNRKIAIKELEEAANLTIDRDEKLGLLDMAAEVHCIINNENGIKAYKKILRIAPDYVRAHFHLAGCYAATGKRELALQEYKFVTEHAPEVATDLESELARFNIMPSETAGR